jgi:hypothetical protein
MRTVGGPIALALVALLSACDPRLDLDISDEPMFLVLSSEWQEGVDPATFQRRAEELTNSLRVLRESTGTGWVGTQDDLTGYLAALEGGSFSAVAERRPGAGLRALLDGFGPSLFGIAGSDLSVTIEQGAPGLFFIRGHQHAGGVEVLDGALAAIFDTNRAAPAITSVRGRVWPGISVETSPVVGRRRAARTTTKLSGGQVQGRPRLVILPDGTGKLAWEVTVAVAGTRVDRYYIDAVRGALLAIRPASI